MIYSSGYVPNSIVRGMMDYHPPTEVVFSEQYYPPMVKSLKTLSSTIGKYSWLLKKIAKKCKKQGVQNYRGVLNYMTRFLDDQDEKTAELFAQKVEDETFDLASFLTELSSCIKKPKIYHHLKGTENWFHPLKDVSFPSSRQSMYSRFSFLPSPSLVHYSETPNTLPSLSDTTLVAPSTSLDTRAATFSSFNEEAPSFSSTTLPVPSPVVDYHKRDSSRDSVLSAMKLRWSDSVFQRTDSDISATPVDMFTLDTQSSTVASEKGDHPKEKAEGVPMSKSSDMLVSANISDSIVAPSAVVSPLESVEIDSEHRGPADITPMNRSRAIPPIKGRKNKRLRSALSSGQRRDQRTPSVSFASSVQFCDMSISTFETTSNEYSSTSYSSTSYSSTDISSQFDIDLSISSDDVRLAKLTTTLTSGVRPPVLDKIPEMPSECLETEPKRKDLKEFLRDIVKSPWFQKIDPSIDKVYPTVDEVFSGLSKSMHAITPLV